MRVTYYAEYDYNGNLIKWIGDDGYEGPLDLAKGGASKTEQSRADALQEQQNALMRQQLGMQQAQFGAVNAVVDPMIARGGMSAEEQNALTSLLTNQLGSAYQSGMGMVNQSLAARGLTGGQMGAGGGAVAGNFGQMAAMLGNAQQQGLSNIELQKAAQLQGLLGLKMGIGSQYGQNIGTFNQGLMSSLGQGVAAAHNVGQEQTSLWGPILGGAFGLGSSAITKYCWIASECFNGWNDIRTQFIRFRLGKLAENSLKYKVITIVYSLIGRKVSKLVKISPVFRKYMTNKFNNFIHIQSDEMLNELIN